MLSCLVPLGVTQSGTNRYVCIHTCMHVYVRMYDSMCCVCVCVCVVMCVCVLEHCDVILSGAPRSDPEWYKQVCVYTYMHACVFTYV